MSRIKEEYRQHTLLAAHHEGKYKGRVWQMKELVHEQTGSDLESLIQELRDWVNSSISERAEAQGERLNAARLLLAVKQILPTLSDGQLAMLKAHYKANEQTLTAGDLARAAGYSGFSGANLQYGFIGKALQELNPIKLPKRTDGSDIYTFYIANASSNTGNEGYWHWKLKPEISDVIEQLGLDV
jgi:hypothetical protein